MPLRFGAVRNDPQVRRAKLLSGGQVFGDEPIIVPRIHHVKRHLAKDVDARRRPSD